MPGACSPFCILFGNIQMLSLGVGIWGGFLIRWLHSLCSFTTGYQGVNPTYRGISCIAYYVPIKRYNYIWFVFCPMQKLHNEYGLCAG